MRVADEDGVAYPHAVCSASIYYPDKTYFLADAPMTPSSTLGNFYVEFMTPLIEGVYEYVVECTLVDQEGSPLVSPSSFHVSPALNFLVEMALVHSQQYEAILERIDDLRTELLSAIDESYSADIVSYINEQTTFLLEQMDQQHHQTLKEVNTKLDVFNRNMARFGQTMTSIFEE